MVEEFAVRMTVLLLGTAWSIIFYFGKRTLDAMDKKMDANFERIEQRQSVLRSSLERSEKRRRYEMRMWQKNTEKRFRLMKIDADRTLSENNKTLQKIFVTRQEFGAFISNINHKIDSIYETLSDVKTGADKI